MIDDALWQEIQRLGIEFVINSISSNRVPDFETTKLNIKQLVDFGTYLLESGTFINHLKKG